MLPKTCLFLFSIVLLSTDKEGCLGMTMRSARLNPYSIFGSTSRSSLNECTGEYEGRQSKGVCYSRSDCLAKNGRVTSACSGGYGVCCVFHYTCAETSQNNISHFVNPNWPEFFNEPSSCTLKVNKVSDEICQIRLDFESFDIVGPLVDNNAFQFHPASTRSPQVYGTVNSQSNCKDDMFIVSHGNRNMPIPIICGKNEGHHMYISVGENDSEGIALTFLIGINEYRRAWNIKVTQISCSDFNLLAPEGCLQYFTVSKGTVKTFNFEGGHYLQNLDYSMCFKKPKNMCSLTLKRNNLSTGVSGAQTPVYNRINNKVTDPSLFSANGSTLEARSQIMHDTCQDAGYWITWPSSDRICSEDIESMTTPATISTVSPQVLHFHSATWDDPKTVKDSVRQGFSLNFTHSPCTHGFFV